MSLANPRVFNPFNFNLFGLMSSGVFALPWSSTSAGAKITNAEIQKMKI
jgi:hypothetical protein